MTLRNPELPRQMDQIARLSKLIDQSPYTFVTDTEVSRQQQIPGGVWQARMDTFIEDPESGVGSDEYEQLYVRALLTQRYNGYLSKAVVARHTRCLKTPASPSSTAEQLLGKLKKAFKP